MVDPPPFLNVARRRTHFVLLDQRLQGLGDGSKVIIRVCAVQKGTASAIGRGRGERLDGAHVEAEGGEDGFNLGWGRGRWVLGKLWRG